MVPLARTGNDRIVTLYCAESLRAAACCVIDALAVRGIRVKLQSGDAARAALRGFRDPKVGLRVLCVVDSVDTATRKALGRALDPFDRKDLLIVRMSTPLAVVEAIEARLGVKRRRSRNKAPTRFTRSYLAHQTIVERPVEVRRWSVYGVAGAIASLAAAALLHLSAASPARDPAPYVTPLDAVAQPTPRTSPLVDERVLSALRPSVVDPPDALGVQEVPVPPMLADVDAGVVEEEIAPLEPLSRASSTPRRPSIPQAGNTLGQAPHLILSTL